MTMACSTRFPGPFASPVSPGSGARCAPVGDWLSVLRGLCNAPRLVRPSFERGGDALATARGFVKRDGSLRKRLETQKPGSACGSVGDLAERRVVEPALPDPGKMPRQFLAKRAKAAPRGFVAEHRAGLSPCVRILHGFIRLPALIAFQHGHPSAVSFDQFFRGK